MRTAIGLLTLALLGLFVLGGYTHYLRGQLATVNRTVVILSASIESRDAAIARLQTESAEREESELALRVSLDYASTAARSREAKMQRLITENATLKNWFHTALPDAVVRLQQRPAFASANDYLRWVSEGNKLPVPGQ